MAEQVSPDHVLNLLEAGLDEDFSIITKTENIQKGEQSSKRSKPAVVEYVYGSSGRVYQEPRLPGKRKRKKKAVIGEMSSAEQGSYRYIACICLNLS